MTRSRGATLVEVLLSLAVVTGGMFAMMAVLSSSMAGSTSASRVDQAESRAQALLESVRLAPDAALDCFAQNSDWSRCGEKCPACQLGVGPWPFRLEHARLLHHGRVWDAEVSVGWGGGHAVTLRTGVFR